MHPTGLEARSASEGDNLRGESRLTLASASGFQASAKREQNSRNVVHNRLTAFLTQPPLASPKSDPAAIQWTHLSSAKGDLPVPHQESKQQTGLLVSELDKDGIADFVVSYRVAAPALVWFRRSDKGWDRYVIEKDFLTVEAGGAAYDIDGDGDLDIVFGADSQNKQLWWWENPYPSYNPSISWKRRVIKDSGENQHHDQVFGDFKGSGKPQLVFWNQKAKALFLADIPADPKNTEPWPYTEIFSGSAGEGIQGAALYAEGAASFDVDGDGKLDLLAGNYWFKHEGGNKFKPVKVGTIGGRIAAGKFKSGKFAQIVIAPGDGSGPVKFYECKGDPAKPESWTGRDLIGRDIIHGHTLDLGDINGDGQLDIFTAEMAKWTREPKDADHPGATAWILYGDGKGNFRKTELVAGHGWHEGRLADLDGDGDIDVLNKPYTWMAPRVDVWLNNGTGARKALPISTAGKRSQSFKGALSMELWTYRKQLAQDLPGTLATIRKLGFSDVETASFYGRSAAEFRSELDKAGLSCSSYITSYDRLNKELDAVVSDANALGARYVLTAGIPRKGNFTLEDCQRAAKDFNRWGEKLKAQGLQFGYHPHGFEFVPTAEGTLFDTLLKLTKPELVEYEIDVFWFFHGGADPVRYLEKYPHRFSLAHLKDLRKGTPTGDLSGKAPDETSVVLGTGQLDFPAILRAAAKAGVKRYYIEDESPDAPQQVPESLKFLKAVRF
ncbi:MAG: FG-GAP-like repeat-containing protein [Acidobacteria bacterium]|nr:FG-GAP-like repeat-containing protein [Acidobacteriota bacterium]